MSPAETQQHSDECQPLEEESGRSCIQKNWMQRKKYLQTQHFCLVFQYTSKHPLKPDRFTLDAKLHVMFIVVMFIFMTPRWQSVC